MKRTDLMAAVRARLTRISTALKVLSDETAVDALDLFPQWRAGEQYTVGDRLQYGGTLYKVLQAHMSQADWTPDAAVSLFAQVLPGQSGTGIGEWVQPDSTNPYMTGDQVLYYGKIYESLIDNNIWSPEAYPAGWKEV